MLSLVNALNLLLRFASIFYLAAAPLLWRQDPALLASMPLLSLGAVAVVAAALLLPGAAPRLLSLAWAAE